MDSRSFHDRGSSDEQPYHLEQKTSLMKTLILESNCHPSQQFSVVIPYNFETRQLDFGRTLHIIFQQIIPQGHQYQVFYYCNQSQYYIFGGMYPFQNYLFLNEDFAGQPIISVKIIRVHPPLAPQMTQTINKKKRINFRTINQVLQKVGEWRNISKVKNITLQQAAKQVDLPKKTLDDYFYQIRQGQYYGFNFQENLNQRIGVLRKFVKQKHKKKEQKPIKILQQFMERQMQENDQQLEQQHQGQQFPQSQEEQ